MDFNIPSNNFYDQYNAFDIHSDWYPCHSIFFRARIKIDNEIYTPSHSFGALYYQRYLKIRVKNSGYKILHNCQALVKVMIPKNADRMRYPSDDEKILAWGRLDNLGDLSTTRTIQAQSSELLHVVFSDSDFVTTPVSSPATRYACISTIERLNPPGYRSEGSANGLRVEDSFSDGVFDIEIMITSDEGPYKRARFKVIVETRYMRLNMRKISWTRCRGFI